MSRRRRLAVTFALSLAAAPFACGGEVSGTADASTDLDAGPDTGVHFGQDYCNRAVGPVDAMAIPPLNDKGYVILDGNVQVNLCPPGQHCGSFEQMGRTLWQCFMN